MRRDAQAALLVLVGGTLLKIGITGTYQRYVKPGNLPLVLAGGAVLVVVAAATIWQLLRPRRQLGAHAAHDDDAVHTHSEPRVGWLLLVPALAILVLAPPALGSFQASRSGTALTAPADSDFPPLPDGVPVRISVLDYASRAVFDHGKSLTGRRITLSGFIIAGAGGTPYLARMVITCCAADARPVKVGLAGNVPANLKPDAWIEVDGGYTRRTDQDPVNGQTIPYIEVTAVRSIPTPSSQYET
jgi:uncharacterized repeat protein (TIGR03943 family)